MAVISSSTNSPLLNALEFHPARRDGTVIVSMPSSLERDFNKIPYSRGVSLLLKKTKVDYCLMFAINKQKLREMMEDIYPYLKENCVLWIAFPKQTSKIMTNLKMNDQWDFMKTMEYRKYRYVMMDSIWGAVRYVKVPPKQWEKIEQEKAKIDISEYYNPTTDEFSLHAFIELAFAKYTTTYDFFKSLSLHQKKSYLSWIHTIKKDIVLQKRIVESIAKMDAGILDPYIDQFIQSNTP